MQRSIDRLTELLCEVPEYSIEDKLNKNIIAELARKYDRGLINKLLSDKDMKKLFFVESDAGLIFKRETFLQFISQKEFLPDSYTAFKSKIGLGTDADNYLSEDSRVVLNWPYKDCVLEGGQDKEDQKRDEVFFNEILAPDQINTILDDKVFTNWKRYDKDGEHDLDELKPNDNLIIKGNNLVVLHSLKKRFAGKIKLIYIDPPFYFSSDKDDSFKYNSNFKLSTWLTFMKNRLKAAYDLLADDGIMMVHVGVEDQGYINVLLDEIFGHENMINHITMTTTEPTGFKAAGKNLVSTANNLFIYKKKTGDINKLYIEKGYDKAYSYVLLNKDEDYKNWKYKTIKEFLAEKKNVKPSAISKDEIAEFAIENADIVFRVTAVIGGALAKRKETLKLSAKNKGVVMKHPNDDMDNFWILNGGRLSFYDWTFNEVDGKRVPSQILTDVWSDISWTGIAKEGEVKLNNGKKPEKLLRRVIELATKPGDIVLDYHLGSGTTAAVAHKLGRQYVGIEQLYYGENDSVNRLKNVIAGDATGISKDVNWTGGGSFVYCNIKNDANTFREKVQHADEKDLEGLLDQVLKSSFLSYRVDPKKVSKKEFEKLSLADKKRILIDLVDNNTLYLNYSEIDDNTYNISKADKRHNKEFYGD